MNIKPKHITLKAGFMNSVFGNCESETILRNILMLQKKTNPEAWTPFSWDDYKAFCTHNVTESERGVLNAFVNGGKPVARTTAYLESGWLNFEDEKYSFSDKMIQMLYDRYPKHSFFTRVIKFFQQHGKL